MGYSSIYCIFLCNNRISKASTKIPLCCVWLTLEKSMSTLFHPNMLELLRTTESSDGKVPGRFDPITKSYGLTYLNKRAHVHLRRCWVEYYCCYIESLFKHVPCLVTFNTTLHPVSSGPINL